LTKLQPAIQQLTILAQSVNLKFDCVNLRVASNFSCQGQRSRSD